jgi:hypothetical protein
MNLIVVIVYSIPMCYSKSRFGCEFLVTKFCHLMIIRTVIINRVNFQFLVLSYIYVYVY